MGDRLLAAIDKTFFTWQSLFFCPFHRLCLLHYTFFPSLSLPLLVLTSAPLLPSPPPPPPPSAASTSLIDDARLSVSPLLIASSDEFRQTH